MSLAFALLLSSLANADERPSYCKEPQFIIHGEPEAHSEPRDEDVLNPDEAANPNLAQQLAASPGPYGHSELGFRYLARLFGYPGRFTSKQAVEDWLLQEEAVNNAKKKGMWKIWQHWVVNPEKRLSVPRGKVNALPLDGDPNMFFLDARDRFEHSHCLKVELATQLCKNFDGIDRDFSRGLIVRFPATAKGAEKFGYCKVAVAPWRQKQEEKVAKEFVEGSKLESALGVAGNPANAGGGQSGQRGAK